MDIQATAASTLDRIRDSIVLHFGFPPNELGADQRLIEDMLLDSLDMVELAMALEAEFQISIPESDWENAADMSLAQVAELIDKRITTREAA